MIIELLAILSFVLMHVIEIVSFSSRAAGKLSNNTALGTTFHYSMHTASRFLLIIFLPSLALMVETMSSIGNYLIVPIVSLFLCFIINGIIILKLNDAQYFFQKVFKLYAENNNLLYSLFKAFFVSKNSLQIQNSMDKFKFRELTPRKYISSSMAYLFLNTGFFIAFLFSLFFYQYRLTVSQFATLFHGLGAVILAFYIDPMLSRSIDESLVSGRWANDMYSILFGRILSYLVSLILFLAVYYFVA